MKRAFSRIFLKQLEKFTKIDQAHIAKAIERVLVDPTLNTYERPYLKEHRQEHPANPQHTIFFEYIKSKDVVFFVWLNDYSCLHTTRKSTDPCVEKFGNLKHSGQIDIFSNDYHLGKLTVNPRVNKPIYIIFEALDYVIHFHVLNDGNSKYYALMLSYDDNKNEQEEAICNEVFKLFLDAFAKHLKNQEHQFEFRLEMNHFNKELIDLIKSQHNSAQWKEFEDDEYFYLVNH